MQHYEQSYAGANGHASGLTNSTDEVVQVEALVWPLLEVELETEGHQ